MNIRNIVLAFSLVLGVFCSLSLAQDISFTSSVGQNPIVMGESTQLRLSIEGTQDVAPLKLPAIDGLEVQYIGPSRQVSMVNGDVSSSIAFTYMLFPRRTGDFVIPGLSLTYQGQQYTTDPITLKVVDNAADSSSGQTLRLEDRIYLDMEVGANEAFVNQGVPVKFMFYASGINVRQISLPEFDSQGFIFKEFTQKPQQGQIVKDGIRFNVVEFNTTIYPTREGELAINPVRMDVSVEMPAEQRNRRAQGLFSDAFFDHFFSNQVRTLSLKSNGAALAVKPLPAEGKPGNFSNAVGEFDFKVNVSPLEVNAGDPLTVKVRLSGEGNLKAVDMPRYSESNEFRTYEPVVKEENGVKILEQVLIPKTHRVKKVPELVFSYFDPLSRTYKSKQDGPFPITVRKAPGSSGISIAGLNQAEEDFDQTEEQFGEDIVYIKEDIGVVSDKGAFLHTQPLFYGIVLVLLVGYGMLWQKMSMQQRLKTDKNYARRHKAKRYIKGELSKLSQLAGKGESASFYNQLGQITQKYLSDIVGVAPGVVSGDALESRSEFQRLPQDMRKTIRAILEECDQVRFASASIDRSNLDQSLDRFKTVVQQLENYDN